MSVKQEQKIEGKQSLTLQFKITATICNKHRLGEILTLTIIHQHLIVCEIRDVSDGYSGVQEGFVMYIGILRNVG